MSEMVREVRREIRELDRMPVERLLPFMGGLFAILFGLLAFILEAIDASFTTVVAGIVGLEAAILTLVVAIVFGFLLVIAARAMLRDRVEGAILALAFGLVLFAFGGFGGVIAGILAIVGSAVAIARTVPLEARST